MAIVVEERRSSGNILSVLIWLAIVAGIGAGVYYLFFEQPALVEVALPAGFESAAQISQVELNPQDVVNDPVFQSLRQYVTLPAVTAAGRPNPFIGF